jgi:beta-lactamase regulating signal transducer with metallopeptidase domain
MDTPTPLFDWILAASARASLLTVVVLLAQAALRHRVPARWRYALWLPVLIVLLMPVFPESAWSVSSITARVAAPTPRLHVIEKSIVLHATPALEAAAQTNEATSWWQVACVAWLVGAAGMVLFGSVAFTRTLWRFKRGCLPVSDALLRELEILAGEVGLRRIPRVWMSSAVGSPAVTGLFRPALLLPANFEQTLAPHEARLVLKHELTHIKRGDLPVHALLCVLLAVHWFNPLLWFAFFKARLDREAACDSQVIESENQTQRVAYGYTLLKVETAFCHHGLSLGFVGIFQRGAALRSRIQSIAFPPKQNPIMKSALCLGIVLLTFLGITRAATPKPDPKAPQILIQAKFVEITEKQGASSSNNKPLPSPLDVHLKKPGIMGILTDPQFQVVIRGLSQRKGVDLMSAPQVTTKSGQPAKIEVVREFVYTDKAGKPIPVNTGVTLSVHPKITDDGQIELDLTPQVLEFMGFVTHKSGWQEPTFSDRKVKVQAEMISGTTMVLELPMRTDEQQVQDADGAGNIIKSWTEYFQRRLYVFVTAQLIEPATGKPIVSEQPGSSKKK